MENDRMVVFCSVNDFSQKWVNRVVKSAADVLVSDTDSTIQNMTSAGRHEDAIDANNTNRLYKGTYTQVSTVCTDSV